MSDWEETLESRLAKFRLNGELAQQNSVFGGAVQVDMQRGPFFGYGGNGGGNDLYFHGHGWGQYGWGQYGWAGYQWGNSYEPWGAGTVAYESWSGAIANGFMPIGVWGQHIGSPPELRARELDLFNRDRETRKIKEDEIRDVKDITIPQWQNQLKQWEVGPPPELRARELDLFNRDRETKKIKEDEIRDVEDITIPQWQIQQIRTQLRLPDIQGNVDFFKHFIHNEDINSPFKNEYLKAINKNLEQILKEESLKNELPLDDSQSERKQSMNNKFYKEYLEKENFEEMKSFREKLPAFGSKQHILQMIAAHQVILVKGETGSGKTTQIPQFILDQAILEGKGSDCRIICTQPRRISAITLSERVAAERGETVGRSVGYTVRLDSKRPRKEGASIMFCTTGIVLSTMQSDPCLNDYSYLILDEIHERDVLTDMLLAITKMILPYRKNLKVILMSATLTADTFSNYFNNCPMVEIPGLTFPVQEFYLEDIVAELDYHTIVCRKVRNHDGDIVQFQDMIDPYIPQILARYSAQVLRTISDPHSEICQNDLIVELICHITVSKPEGAILVFLPSLSQIAEIHKLITSHPLLPELAILVYPLHSKVPPQDQMAVFSRPPPDTRKVILATNIAETSITIDDVVFVINAGRHKINMYEDGVSSLSDEWISISNEIQRKGRAGRVQPGVCYHLYTRARRNVLLQNTPPEILRVTLDEVILNIKILALGDARRFFEKLLDRPSDAVIEESLQLLNRLNAIDDNETLTPLGYHLARLPMDPRTGKMVLLSSIFSCTDPITSIAASLSFKDAFYKPFGMEKEVDRVRRKFANGCHSDHLMLANVIQEWSQLPKRGLPYFARTHFLNQTTLHQLCSMKAQFCEYFHAAKFLEQAQPAAFSNNYNSGNDKLLTAIIGAGMYPNVASVEKIISKRKKTEGRVIINIEGQGRAMMHPSSVNSTLQNYESNFVVYYEKQKISELTIFDSTVVNPFPLFFFGDNHVVTHGGYELISIAGQYCLKCNKETYRLIQDLRGCFNLFLQKKICVPSPVDWTSEEGDFLRVIIELITMNGKFRNSFDEKFTHWDASLAARSSKSK